MRVVSAGRRHTDYLLMVALMMSLIFAAVGCSDASDVATPDTVPLHAAAVDIADTAVADGSAPGAEERANTEFVGPSMSADATWQWQLTGEIDISYDVDVYDVDLVEVPADVIDELHVDGRVVICYFSAGSVEEYRDDAGDLPAAVIGEPLDGWPDERWLDTRDTSVRDVMEQRLDLAVTRGCDGVEPDNVAAFEEDNGFGLERADQLDFNRFLATAAHERGLLVGLKNDLSQIPDLVDEFDFAVNESCLEFDECAAYVPFVDVGKAVLGAEYSAAAVDDPDATCAAASEFGLRTLVLPLALDDSFRIACP